MRTGETPRPSETLTIDANNPLPTSHFSLPTAGKTRRACSISSGIMV
jgi:hypothetical protein